MPIVMSGNYIFVRPGEKCYKIASNFTNYVEVGLPGGTEYYLEARIESDSFVLNGILWGPGGTPINLRDNFPDGPASRRQVLPNGYRILAQDGQPLLGIEVVGDVCLIRGRLLDKDGAVIAEESGDDFLIHRGPAVLGKSGGSRGIVLE